MLRKQCGLALRLQDQGWEQRTLGEDMAPGQEAKFWSQMCLLSSQTLFEECQVRVIYHGPIEADCDCLLRLPPDRKKDVAPWRKATVYRAMPGGKSQPSGQTSMMMGLFVDEHGHSVLEGLAGPRQGEVPALSRNPGG